MVRRCIDTRYAEQIVANKYGFEIFGVLDRFATFRKFDFRKLVPILSSLQLVCSFDCTQQKLLELRKSIPDMNAEIDQSVNLAIQATLTNHIGRKHFTSYCSPETTVIFFALCCFGKISL